MPAVDHPTAAELREQRTWRVVTLCCESSDPDWHGEGASIPPGGRVLIRLQGYRDGRCGWIGADAVEVTIDDSPTKVTSGFEPGLYPNWSLGAVEQHDLWLAWTPDRLAPGRHRLGIQFRACTWSGTLDVGEPRSVPAPVPTLSTDFRWVHLPDHGAAVWWVVHDWVREPDEHVGTPAEYDLSLEHWLHLPPHYIDSPVVVCAIDAQGHSHGAWEVRDTEDDHYKLINSELVPIKYPPCEAMR